VTCSPEELHLSFGISAHACLGQAIARIGH